MKKLHVISLDEEFEKARKQQWPQKSKTGKLSIHKRRKALSEIPKPVKKIKIELSDEEVKMIESEEVSSEEILAKIGIDLLQRISDKL